MINTNLCSVKTEEYYVIKSIEVLDVALNKQLKNLGFLVGEKMKVMKTNYGKTSYLVKVMGVNYAIDKKVAERIFVEYE